MFFFFAYNNMMYMVFTQPLMLLNSAKLRATVDHATNNKHILLTSIVISSGFVTLLAKSLVGPRQQSCDTVREEDGVKCKILRLLHGARSMFFF